MEPSLALATWIAARTPSRPDAMTHLKLQKLMFYGFGAALAHGTAWYIGPVEFQAWKHGPVCRAVYDMFKGYKSAPLPLPDRSAVPSLGPAEPVLEAVINVYGRLTAWQLRQESHLEQPWRDRWNGTPDVLIEPERLQRHFYDRFCTGRVTFPERLFGGSSLLLDRIPMPVFPDLYEMSRATTAILG